MSQSFFDDVKDFHVKFGLPSPSSPQPLSEHLNSFRTGFMHEELGEYMDAVRDGDLEKQLDSLVDLVYVACGTAVMHGFDFNEAWRRVHEANLKKVRVERLDDSKRASTFDVVKPAGWQHPDLFDLVQEVK